MRTFKQVRKRPHQASTGLSDARRYRQGTHGGAGGNASANAERWAILQDQRPDEEQQRTRLAHVLKSARVVIAFGAAWRFDNAYGNSARFVWDAESADAVGSCASVFGPKRAGGIMGRLTTWLKRLGFRAASPTSASPAPGGRVIFFGAKTVDGELGRRGRRPRGVARAGIYRVDMPDCR